MANSSLNRGFPTMRRIQQRTDYHCGPAVISMLASYLNVTIKQHDIVVAADANTALIKRGMTVRELALGLHKINPELILWYKNGSTIKDIIFLIDEFKYPVGVEWQGVFGKYSDEDNGHYSIITYVNKIKNILALSDPFFNSSHKDRIFTIDGFLERWWDINKITNQDSDVIRVENDKHMLFIVTHKGISVPDKLKLKKYF